MPAASKQPAAQAVVKFMSSPEVAPLIRKSGMENCQAQWRKDPDRSHTLRVGREP